MQDGVYNFTRKEWIIRGVRVMERIWIYFLAAVNITVGFLILHRGTDRYGFDTYRGFLDREEKRGQRK